MFRLIRKAELRLGSKRYCALKESTNAFSSNIRDFYDMVVVGGGIVGMALSCAIGNTPSLSTKRILVIESSSTPPMQTISTQPYNKRVCSLSLGSIELLKRLNVWQDIKAVRCKGFKSIYVWDSCSQSSISFSSRNHIGLDIPNYISRSPDHVANEDNEDVMGYIIENDVIVKALNDKVQECDNVLVKRGTAINNVDIQDGCNNWLPVTLSDGSVINTRLLVGADGVRSHVRHMTGLQAVGWNYNQSAVVATLSLESGFTENHVSWQRFLPSGPIALLPLSDTQSSLVWSTSTEHAKNLLQMSEGDFVDSINTALFDELPISPLVETTNEIVRSIINSMSPANLTPRQYPPSIVGVDVNSRGMFPLSTSHVPNYVKPQIVLIGDSAHHIHPLAGLGVNLGLGDVTCLHHHLTQANDIGEEWGFLPRLLQYETDRQRQNIPVMGVVESIQRLYGTSFMPTVLVRSIGLQLVDSLWPMKDFISNKAQNT